MIRTAIVGFGKIAADQHVPAMAANPDFTFAAAASRSPLTLDVPTFTDHLQMLAKMPLDAVSVCTPPSVRYGIARDCLEAGKHVMLEKPPGVTLGEVEVLARIAADRGVTLMTTWHAQANPAVTAAAELLDGERIASTAITWHEDVRKWHPGQNWVWEPGGFGVFDPGINALSIVSRIVPADLIVRSARLYVPANKAMPIAADLVLASPAADADMTVSLDWRRSEGEEWTIEIATAAGKQLSLTDGGARLLVDGIEQVGKQEGGGEYPALYARFAELIAGKKSAVDLAPLRIVADAFLLAERTQIEAFEG